MLGSRLLNLFCCTRLGQVLLNSHSHSVDGRGHSTALPTIPSRPPARSVMLKVERRIDSGQLRMQDEVSGALPSDLGGAHATCSCSSCREPFPSTGAAAPACLLHFACMQESVLRNVKLAAQARALLGSYHPVWLHLGAEVVVGRALAGGCLKLLAPSSPLFNPPPRHELALARAPSVPVPAQGRRRPCLPAPPLCRAESDAPAQPAQVAAFLRDHFLSEPQLARQHSPTSKPYWVRGCWREPCRPGRQRDRERPLPWGPWC